MKSDQILKEISVRELFSQERYLIPIYQRNYEWREPQINQLVLDIADSVGRSSGNANYRYYIGTLVVWSRPYDGRFDVIDGQQRLTTLLLMLFVLRQMKPELMTWLTSVNLEFESRKESSEVLEFMFKNIEYEFGDLALEDKGSVGDLKAGLEIARKSIQRVLDEFQININDFVDVLLEHVVFLRVEVPRDTDLNHYLEIMNSRGEQLEKHEILKAELMNVFIDNGREDEADAFGVVWDACSDMDRYVQMCFDDIGVREALFGETWDDFLPKCFEDIVKDLSKDETSENASLSLEAIVRHGPSGSRRKFVPRQENPDSRFKSVINFQNFLLHVLRVSTQDNISLDDKNLISVFSGYFKSKGDDKERNKDKVKCLRFVRRFCFSLLKCRFLFDHFVIKREYDSRWRVQRLSKGKDSTLDYTSTFGEKAEGGDKMVQKEIEMILAMFHVSYPTMIYKHWLNAVLKYLVENDSFSAREYRTFLEELAEKFLRWRVLAKKPIDYYKLVYEAVEEPERLDLNRLNMGTAVENFVFNYLDYKLWKLYKYDYPTFEFTVRSSVEHYYPQNPLDEDCPRLNQNILDSFGNLCLISPSRNSSLGRLKPEVKKGYYENRADRTFIESIKQRLMFKADTWGPKEINQHGRDMSEVLMSPCYSRESTIQYVMSVVDCRMQKEGFSRGRDSVLTDDTCDDVNSYYEKGDMKIVFSSEKKNCAAMYVGVYKNYVGRKWELKWVSARLPDWEYDDAYWCYHLLLEQHRNWSNEFLMSCRREKLVLDALVDEVVSLIQEAYAAMNQVIG